MKAYIKKSNKNGRWACIVIGPDEKQEIWSTSETYQTARFSFHDAILIEANDYNSSPMWQKGGEGWNRYF